MSYNLETGWDAANHLVVAVLKEDLESLQEDLSELKRRKKAGHGGCMYSTDINVDIKKTKQLIKACKRMLRYYGGRMI